MEDVDAHLFYLFVLATTVLMLIPGPNVALITANSIAHGTRYGLLTVAGTSAAMVPQLLLAALGLTSLLARMGQWFEVLRWIGVIYLVGLGVALWLVSATEPAAVHPEPKSWRVIVGRGFLVSMTNPKTLLFYGAFFPQFVRPGTSPTGQVWTLALTFLIIALIVDSLWAMLAGRLRVFLSARARTRQRLTGSLLIGAGLGLALARRR